MSKLSRTAVIVILFILVQTTQSRYIDRSLVAQNATRDRNERFFSLFSIVRFANSICSSNQGYNGTCLTMAECAQRGGSADGSCAAGFGVCCSVFITTCGSTARLNNSYWQSPGYSSSYSTPGQCSIYIEKCASNICQFRLDFVNFVIAGPDSSSATTNTQCLIDIFTVSGMSNNVPGICGTNIGQHIYLNLAPGTSSITLNMLLTGTTTSRVWLIRISQIPCGTTYTAPDNCLQWYTNAVATFSSFNYQFSTTPAVQHLANQDYTICIRMNQGFCGIGYQVCDTTVTAALSQFLISIEAATTIVDSACLTDWVQIPCATNQQNPNQLMSNGNGCVNKICGSAFSSITGATTPVSVYSYRKPFEVRFYTDSFDATATEGIGFCFKYTQQPCVTTTG